MGTVRLEVDGGPPVEVAVGLTVLEACEAHGLTLATDCGGFAACASCRVRVLQGEALLDAVDPLEDAFLDEPGQRLGCQARLVGEGSLRLARDPG